MEDDITTGDLVRIERDQKRMSRSALADRVGVTSEAIRLIEVNKRTPSFDLLVRISEALGVSVNTLTVNHETLRRYTKRGNEPFYICLDGELIQVLTYRRLGKVLQASRANVKEH